MTLDGPRPPTIYDVADRAGVSKSLVSLVLRGSPQVSERRRGAVLTAISELGYRPSQAATLLASTRTRAIEVIIDDYRNPWFVDLVHGLRDGLAGHGYHLSVTEAGPLSVTAAGPHAPDSPGRRSSLAAPADGRVLAAEVDAEALAAWSGPTVVAGSRETIPAGADLVASDDRAGIHLAGTHLRSLGHRAIAHLTGSGGPAHQRRAGFEEFARSAAILVRIVGERGGTTEADGYRAAARVLDEHPDVTAIVAANDVMALGAMAAASEHGLAVPADLSITGYDDSPLAQSRYLSLTSVDSRNIAVGAAAADALLTRLADPTAPARRALIAPALVVRGTTGPAPP